MIKNSILAWYCSWNEVTVQSLGIHPPIDHDHVTDPKPPFEYTINPRVCEIKPFEGNTEGNPTSSQDCPDKSG